MVTAELSRSSMRGMAFYSKVWIYGRRISGLIHRLVGELFCNKSSRSMLTFHSCNNSCRIFYIISRWDKSSGRLMEFSTLIIQNQRVSPFQWCFLFCSSQCRNHSLMESKIEKWQKQPKHSSAKSNPGPSFDWFSFWLWWGWAGRIPWRREQLPTPVFLPGESHGQRSLTGYSPWGCRESDTDWTTFTPDANDGISNL